MCTFEQELDQIEYQKKVPCDARKPTVEEIECSLATLRRLKKRKPSERFPHFADLRVLSSVMEYYDIVLFHKFSDELFSLDVKKNEEQLLVEILFQRKMERALVALDPMLR